MTVSRPRSFHRAAAGGRRTWRRRRRSSATNDAPADGARRRLRLSVSDGRARRPAGRDGAAVADGDARRAAPVGAAGQTPCALRPRPCVSLRPRARGASSSSRLRASAASRSSRSRASRSARALASISARRRSSSSRDFGADQRAGAGLALLIGQGAQNDAGRCERGAARRCSLGWRRGRRRRRRRLRSRAARRPASPVDMPGRRGASPSRRRPPWCGHARSSDAPCRARPALLQVQRLRRSDGQSCRRVLGFAHPVSRSWVSRPVRVTSRQPVRRSRSISGSALAAAARRMRRFAPIGLRAAGSARESRRRPAPAKGSMYHICPAQRQIQLDRRKYCRRRSALLRSRTAARRAFARVCACRRRRRRAPGSARRRRRRERRRTTLPKPRRRARPCWRSTSICRQSASSKRSTSSAKLGGAIDLGLKPRANSCLRAASATTSARAVTQRRGPAACALISGTSAPSGPRTKRIIASGEPLAGA